MDNKKIKPKKYAKRPTTLKVTPKQKVVPKNLSVRGANFYEEYEFSSGHKVPIYEVTSVHALSQIIGHAKFNNQAYGNIFCRGECKLHDSLKPSLFRTRKNIEVATSHVTQLIQKISSDSHMTNDLKLGKYREEQKRHVIEGVLQHYGISTRFIDIVDNHWVALWMGLNRIEKSKQINTYYHYLERYIPLAQGSLEKQDYYQYILLIAVPFSTKPITMGISESKEYVMVDLRQALPSVFLRPHAQHGLIVRKKVAPPCTPESYDMAPNVVGIIKIRIDRVKEWIGTGELLTQDNLFPSPAFDYGYDLLLKRNDLFEEEEFQIAKFV